MSSSPPNTPTQSSQRGFANLLSNLQPDALKGKKHNMLNPYEIAGKHMCRGINPFVDVGTVFYFATAKASLEAGDDTQAALLATIGKATLDSYVLIYNQIMIVVPGFNQLLLNFEDHATELGELITKIKDAAFSARQSDTSHLKKDIKDYLMPNAEDLLQPPIATSISKADRGFMHRTTAFHLCPARYVADLEEDYFGTIAKLSDGRIPVVAEDFPNFLFSAYNPDDLKDGLLRGFVLVRTYRHIFTGPTSALLTPTRKKNKTRKDNATISKLTRVTPTTIAYAAIQARFALSTVEQWSDNDGEFNVPMFFDAIVNLFAPDPEDPANPTQWATDTLEWWNMQVFAPSAQSHGATDENNVAPSFQDTLAAQRQAKKAASQLAS